MHPEAFPCESCNCENGDAGFYRWQIIGEPVFTDETGRPSNATRTCPRRLVTDYSTYLIGFYSHYKAGHLLVAGGISDQPALYLDAMQLIDGAVEQARTHARQSSS